MEVCQHPSPKVVLEQEEATTGCSSMTMSSCNTHTRYKGGEAQVQQQAGRRSSRIASAAVSSPSWGCIDTAVHAQMLFHYAYINFW